MTIVGSPSDVTSADGPRSWPDRFETIVRSFLPGLPDTETLTREASLLDLGLDSVGILQLLLDIEDAFGIIIPDDVLRAETFATAGSLWSTVGAIAENA